MTRVAVSSNCKVPHCKSTLGRLLSPLMLVDSGTFRQLKLNSQGVNSKGETKTKTLGLDGGHSDLECVTVDMWLTHFGELYVIVMIMYVFCCVVC